MSADRIPDGDGQTRRAGAQEDRRADGPDGNVNVAGGPGEWSVRPPVRMCVRCREATAAPVLVCEVHANTGPGWNVYACPDCAPHLPPAPDPLEVIERGRAARRAREEERRKGAGPAA